MTNSCKYKEIKYSRYLRLQLFCFAWKWQRMWLTFLQCLQAVGKCYLRFMLTNPSLYARSPTNKRSEAANKSLLLDQICATVPRFSWECFRTGVSGVIFVLCTPVTIGCIETIGPKREPNEEWKQSFVSDRLWSDPHRKFTCTMPVVNSTKKMVSDFAETNHASVACALIKIGDFLASVLVVDFPFLFWRLPSFDFLSFVFSQLEVYFFCFPFKIQLVWVPKCLLHRSLQ